MAASLPIQWYLLPLPVFQQVLPVAWFPVCVVVGSAVCANVILGVVEVGEDSTMTSSAVLYWDTADPLRVDSICPDGPGLWNTAWPLCCCGSVNLSVSYMGCV